MPYTGLHWLLNLPVFLTVLYMLHLDLLMAKKAFFLRKTDPTNHEAVHKLHVPTELRIQVPVAVTKEHWRSQPALFHRIKVP